MISEDVCLCMVFLVSYYMCEIFVCGIIVWLFVKYLLDCGFLVFYVDGVIGDVVDDNFVGWDDYCCMFLEV